MIIIPDIDAAQARSWGRHFGTCFALAEAIYDTSHRLGLHIHPRTIAAEARFLVANRQEVRVYSGGHVTCREPGMVDGGVT